LSGRWKNSLRSRRDRSRAQSFGLVEEKKPRGEWGGGARFLAPSALASRGKVDRKAASPPKLRTQIQFHQLRSHAPKHRRVFLSIEISSFATLYRPHQTIERSKMKNRFCVWWIPRKFRRKLRL